MTHLSKKIKTLLVLMIFILLVQACSIKKHIPEGEQLYRGGTVKIPDTISVVDKDKVQEELNNLLYPEPNSKNLGTYFGLYFHYKAQGEKPGFLNRFFNKKIGEEPVYLSSIPIEKTKELILNRLENNGFFSRKVNSSTVIDSSAKTAKTRFDVLLTEPYLVENFQVDQDSLDSLPILKDIQKSLSNSVIKKGMRFNLNAMKKERTRIDEYLKDKGYYNFNEDFLIFEADTNQYKNRRLDLFLQLKNNVPEKTIVPYVIDSVKVFPNALIENKDLPKDTTSIDSITFIQSENFFKPKHLKPYLLFKPGQKYSPIRSKYTSRRLSSIGTYKFVNIRYNEADTITDKDGNRHLDATIYLSPLNKRSLRAELQGVTKSNNFTGPGLGLTYTNRNLFRGGENLTIGGNFGYEKQFISGEDSGLSSLLFGINTALTFPRVLFPIKGINERFKYAIPKTKVSLGVEYLNRSKLYSLSSVSTSFGYIWNENRFVTHELNPINIDYVNLTNTTNEFEAILDENPFLRRSFEQQFIAGLTYSFTYSELGKSNKPGKFHAGFNFDIAGNVVDLLGKNAAEGERTFLGLAYAQYAKADIDIRYHYDTGSSGQTLVARLFGGVGLPYGNSTALPFVKQYFSGGPYSVRAFRIRSLGPGTYVPEDDANSYFDQAGDIRLEANLEYRFPIISFLKGAIFADAGNVWLINNNEALPGGKFSSGFINELGIGAGIGLRVDIQSFVIRFDLASPLKTPAEDWDFQYDTPVFNFAIGYPF